MNVDREALVDLITRKVIEELAGGPRTPNPGSPLPPLVPDPSPHDAATCDRCRLWGVNAVLCHDVMNVAEMTEVAIHTALKLGFAKPGQTIVIAAGMPFGTPGTTNLLRIAQVG